jgi:hypothetical protein
MKEYIEAELEIVAFEAEDIITESTSRDANEGNPHDPFG